MENAQISSIVKWLSVFWSFRFISPSHWAAAWNIQHYSSVKRVWKKKQELSDALSSEWTRRGEERRCDSGVIHQFPDITPACFPYCWQSLNAFIRRVTRARKHVKKVNWCKCLRLRLRLTLLVWASWRSWTRPWFGSPPNSLRFHSANVSVWIVY